MARIIRTLGFRPHFTFEGPNSSSLASVPMIALGWSAFHLFEELLHILLVDGFSVIIFQIKLAKSIFRIKSIKRLGSSMVWPYAQHSGSASMEPDSSFKAVGMN